MNYLIDENSDTGKGGNTVASYLHHFFHTWGLGEERVFLHADNCVGQNKNNYVLQVSNLYILLTGHWLICCIYMQYLMWRVIVGLHEEITLSFLPVGHTKFAPDWCFGLLKKKFRYSVVSSLDDFVRVVEESGEVNTSQLVGSQDGEILVLTYDWATYLGSFFKKLKGIKKYHKFRFSAHSPGIVFVKKTSDENEPEQQHKILSADYSSLSVAELPAIVPPSRLSQERQWYLYNSIRQYCTLETRDLTCPLPSVSAPVPPPAVPPPLTVLPPLTVPPVSPQEQTTPQAKRRRQCGRCNKPGHNRATCNTEI